MVVKAGGVSRVETIEDADTPTVTVKDTTNNVTGILSADDDSVNVGSTTNHIVNVIHNDLTVATVTANGLNTDIGGDTPGSASVTTLAVSGAVSGASVLDDDSMASATATTLATAESIKAYVDSGGGGISSSIFDAHTILQATSDNTPVAITVAEQTVVGRITSGNIKALSATEIRTLINVESGSTADQSNAEIKTAYEANADTNEFSNAEQTKLSGIETSATADQTGAQIKTAYEAESNAFTDTKNTKLSGIETSADVTDEANVTAALPVDDATALVDSGTDKAMRIDVGAVSDSTTRVLTMPDSNIDLTPGSGSFATEAEGTLAAAALPKGGGAMTGAITTNSTFDGRNVATDGTKLDGIEAGDAVAFAIALG